jgi:hypothetical protein
MKGDDVWRREKAGLLFVVRRERQTSVSSGDDGPSVESILKEHTNGLSVPGKDRTGAGNLCEGRVERSGSANRDSEWDGMGLPDRKERMDQIGKQFDEIWREKFGSGCGSSLQRYNHP